MTFLKLVVAGSALLATVGQAAALERRGTATLQWPDGKGPVHEFRTVYEPATGAVTRSGTIRFADGRTVSYEANGRCEPGLRACSWAGAGTGPWGGRWAIGGSFSREANGENRMEQTFTAPTGQKIVVRHSSGGDRFPVEMP